MQKKRPWLSLVVAGAVAAAATGAFGAGLGEGARGAVLGQTLDFVVPLRLEPGETLSPDCLAAEVHFGERRLASGQIQASVEMQAAEGPRIRVLSSQPIDEPTLTVQISAGCAARVTRRFVVLADPPSPASAVIVAAPAFAAAVAEVNPAAAPTPAAASADGARAQGLGEASVRGASVVRRVAQREGGSAAARPRGEGARSGARASARRQAASAQRADATRRTRRASAPAAAVAAAAAPRLKLDFSEPLVASDRAVEQALLAVQEAASAASAAAERIASLERNMDQLRKDAKGNRDLATDLRERLAKAEASGAWIWVLTAFAMLLGALAAWLAARLATARRERHEAWVAATAASRRAAAADAPAVARQPTAPLPFVSSEVAVPASPPATSRPRPAPAWPPAAPADPWKPAPVPAPATKSSSKSSIEAAAPTLARAAAAAPPVDQAVMQTMPLPQPFGNEAAGTRDVSIDELLDLEQQAEFFVVLGQDDAAVELLVEHLRHTGGGSPLPYLKLLEIYRRRGDRSDYERTRARFNHRFNAYAPEWEVDLQTGRTLADYPGVIPRLQQVWSRPLDSMAELEALLFRKSRGELFDLPAYREVLFLYALARDLLDRESADTGTVDLLLPLPDGSEFSSTAPAPYLELGRESGFGELDFEERPTAPVDLDLSIGSDRPASIFDPLEDPPPNSRR